MLADRRWSVADPLTVSFEYSPVEHVRALEETPYRRMVARWWVPGSIVFLAVMFGSVAIRRDLHGPTARWLFTLTVLPMLAMMLATPAIIRRFEIARYRRAQSRGAKERETLQFGAEGFTPGGERLQPIPWPMITRVIESDNFYLFYHALSDVRDYVPKRALAPSDSAALEALLQDQFRARKSADLQLRSGHSTPTVKKLAPTSGRSQATSRL